MTIGCKSFLLLVICCLSWSSSAMSKQRMTVHAGIDRGGPTVGFDYAVPDTRTESFGVYGRLHSKDSSNGAPGIVALGAFFRNHFQQGPYEFYIAPGFGFINYDLFETEVLIGPSLAYGMTAELDANIGIGIENHKLYSWFGEIKGSISDTFLVHFQYRM